DGCYWVGWNYLFAGDRDALLRADGALRRRFLAAGKDNSGRPGSHVLVSRARESWDRFPHELARRRRAGHLDPERACPGGHVVLGAPASNGRFRGRLLHGGAPGPYRNRRVLDLARGPAP